MLNKFRSMLTALGIIFGVAAVIAMMAIGNGAKQEILEQIKMIGVNNIIVVPKKIDESTQEKQQQKGEKPTYSPGLNLLDAYGIKEIVPDVNKISAVVSYETYITSNGIRKKANLTGIDENYFDIFNLELAEGSFFTKEQLSSGVPVCIIGPAVKNKFFNNRNPVNTYIKCGDLWLMVIGVIKDKGNAISANTNLGISDYSNEIFAPLQTVLLRFKDRSLITASKLKSKKQSTDDDGSSKLANYHQLDKIIIQANEPIKVQIISEIVYRMLLRRHNNKEDFEIKIPELLLKQEQRTKDIFNIVLGAIASISLLVGGIGIMNIMLANVMERTKEIGIRLAIGATKKDVIIQFLAEASMISIIGGAIGILLGVILSYFIYLFSGILTIVSVFSILISFVVSATVGIIFGYMPAQKAAKADPVSSLRYE